MTELNLRFEFSKDENLDQIAKILETRVSQLQNVKETEAIPERMKLTGLEVAVAIGVTVLVVRNTRELIEEIRKLIPEVQGLATDLRTIYISVGNERVALEDLNDEHYRLLEQG